MAGNVKGFTIKTLVSKVSCFLSNFMQSTHLSKNMIFVYSLKFVLFQALFVFVVIGSAVFQIIQSVWVGGP